MQNIITHPTRLPLRHSRLPMPHFAAPRSTTTPPRAMKINLKSKIPNLKFTSRLPLLLALLFAGGAVRAADEATAAQTPLTPVYTNYMDWQFRAVEIADTNAADNVRHQNDFTVPIHGPWLLNPSPDSITVNWITRIPCGAAIDYREKGAAGFTRVWKTTYGQIDYSSDLHTFHLEGLKPATTYEYRLVSNCDRHFTAYLDVYVGREIYSFRTIDPQRSNYKVFVTADHHGSARLTLDPMINRCGADDADFYFFLGDNVEDNMNNARFYVTFGFLDDISRRWGPSKPTVFLRGNHDLWGRESHRWGDFFPRPDGKSYLAFAQGPALFVCLDSMAAGYGSPAQREQVARYLQEQAEWIGRLKRGPLWRKSAFRIVMAHYGIHGSSMDKTMAPVFKQVLNDSSAAGRIHLYLAGHEHRYMRIDPRSSDTKVGEISPNSRSSMDLKPDNSFTHVICTLTEGMTIEVAPQKLTVRSHLWNQPAGGLRDAFEIRPDGSVKDLMEVKVFPAPAAEQDKSR